MTKYFITATGTNIVKTLITTALAHQLRAAGKSVSALKPVISGYDEADEYSDTRQLLAAQNLPIHKLNVEAISPWRFAALLAPNVAARMEQKTIDFAEVVKFCAMPRITEYTLIEGAGGVMSPLTDSHTQLDLMTALSCKIILVAGDYLGSISHTLSAAEVLRARGVHVQAIIVSSQGEVRNTAAEIKRFLPDIPFIVPLPKVAGTPPLWQHVAEITWMLL